MARDINEARQLLDFVEAADQDERDVAYVITYDKGIQPPTYKDLNAKAEPVSSSQNEAKKTRVTRQLLVHTEIGRGAFAVVFRATMFEGQKGTQICLKRNCEDNFKYLEHENRILSILNKYPRHPNVIKREFLCIPDNEPCWFLGLELFEGETLMDIITKMTRGMYDRFSDEQLIVLLEEQASAVGHILRYDIYHYDIHPGNIMYNRYKGRSMLIDFGCAIENGKLAVVPGGTIEYMAPEVMLSLYLRPGSDVYGLAATIHHLITLSCPWYSLNRRNNLRDAVSEHIMPQLKSYGTKRRRAPVLAVQEELKLGKCDERFKQILTPMLNLFGRDRPTCDDVIRSLSELKRNMCRSGRSNDSNNVATLQPPSADSTSANYYKSENIAVKSTRLTARPINSTPEAMDTSSSLEGAQTSAYQPEDSDDSDDL